MCPSKGTMPAPEHHTMLREARLTTWRRRQHQDKDSLHSQPGQQSPGADADKPAGSKLNTLLAAGEAWAQRLLLKKKRKHGKAEAMHTEQSQGQESEIPSPASRSAATSAQQSCSLLQIRGAGSGSSDDEGSSCSSLLCELQLDPQPRHVRINTTFLVSPGTAVAGPLQEAPGEADLAGAVCAFTRTLLGQHSAARSGSPGPHGCNHHHQQQQNQVPSLVSLQSAATSSPLYPASAAMENVAETHGLLSLSSHELGTVSGGAAPAFMAPLLSPRWRHSSNRPGASGYSHSRGNSNSSLAQLLPDSPLGCSYHDSPEPRRMMVVGTWAAPTLGLGQLQSRRRGGVAGPSALLQAMQARDMGGSCEVSSLTQAGSSRRALGEVIASMQAGCDVAGTGAGAAQGPIAAAASPSVGAADAGAPAAGARRARGRKLRSASALLPTPLLQRGGLAGAKPAPGVGSPILPMLNPWAPTHKRTNRLQQQPFRRVNTATCLGSEAPASPSLSAPLEGSCSQLPTPPIHAYSAQMLPELPEEGSEYGDDLLELGGDEDDERMGLVASSLAQPSGAPSLDRQGSEQYRQWEQQEQWPESSPWHASTAGLSTAAPMAIPIQAACLAGTRNSEEDAAAQELPSQHTPWLTGPGSNPSMASSSAGLHLLSMGSASGLPGSQAGSCFNTHGFGMAALEPVSGGSGMAAVMATTGSMQARAAAAGTSHSGRPLFVKLPVLPMGFTTSSPEPLAIKPRAGSLDIGGVEVAATGLDTAGLECLSLPTAAVEAVALCAAAAARAGALPKARLSGPVPPTSLAPHVKQRVWRERVEGVRQRISLDLHAGM